MTVHLILTGVGIALLIAASLFSEKNEKLSRVFALAFVLLFLFIVLRVTGMVMDTGPMDLPPHKF